MERTPVCVYCRRRPVDPAQRPFCSERCRLLDLGGWLKGSYRIAGEPLPSERDPQTSEPDLPAGPEPPPDDA